MLGLERRAQSENANRNPQRQPDNADNGNGKPD
jgi:hypothetical protein